MITPGLKLPLTVVLESRNRRLDITNEVRDLSFSDLVPGGFATVDVSLHRPLSVQPDEIEYFGSLYVYDARNGAILGWGTLEDPGRSAGQDGQIWSLHAAGPSSHASDRTEPYIAIDSSMERWERAAASNKTAIIDQGEYSDDVPGWLLKAQEGLTVPTNWVAEIIYRAIRNANGGKIGRAKCRVDDGAAISSWKKRMLTGIGSPSTVVHTLDWNFTVSTLNAQLGGTILTNHDIVTLRILYTGAPAAAAANTWAHFIDIVVMATLKDKAGNDVSTTLYGDNWYLTHWVVEDILARFLPRYDGAGATVDSSSTYQHDQLAWPDGATPARMFEDLMTLDPAYYWAAWEPTSSGKARFEWVPWPTEVRYEIDLLDGADMPGSAAELYNRVVVRYRNIQGQTKSVVRTQVIPELDDRGLTRSEVLDLGDEIGSAASAIQAGDAFLAEHRYPPNAGTLNVTRPVLDLLAGRLVMPWEIRSGNLIRARGVLPRINSLNTTTRDGVTVFRIVGKDFNAQSATAALQLDSYPRTVEQALAKLRRSPALARRRR